ncbi:unnamed protein product [Soboliphyme baturini]|uniref:BPL_C domain-containing protein n=1 Tax=Soboliphyme baturini TaxID=241478 RepID=A0A183JAE4_9BILA|nr:unnamed protein product [Soboliphyme baturini]
MGCGLNVANPEPTVCVNQILSPTTTPFTCEQVIAIVLSRLEHLIQIFEREGVDSILPLYYKYWLHKDQKVTLYDTSQSVTIIGLDKDGYLRVKAVDTNEVFSVQPDGNTFDMSRNLIRCKTC